MHIFRKMLRKKKHPVCARSPYWHCDYLNCPNNYFRFSFETSQKKEKLQANVNVSLFFVITVYSNDKLKPPKSNIRTQRVRRKCKLLILVKNASLVKRGRGRPRKDSLGSNMSHVQAYFLDEGKTHRKLLTYHIIYNNYADLSYTVGSHIHPTHTHTQTSSHTHILTVN